jgi:uncharacterized protein
MKKILSIILVLFFVSFANSQDKPLFEQSAPSSLVYDEAELLTSNEKTTLEEKLNNFDRQTSTQIIVVITNDLHNYDVDDYATRLLETWKPGKANKDNGLVILIKTKSDTKGEIAISTGYGIEPFVTDAVARRIIEVEVIPEFKHNNYYTGIDNAINTIISLTQGEFTADKYMNSSKVGSRIPAVIVMVVLFIIFGFFGRRGGGRSMGGSSLPFWLIMGSMASSRGSGFGGFSGGSGGFGGFGGGMGGGGGASGSW